MSVLSWLGPPVVGAAIGFITNDIAIRMLFRPLREIRVLGLRMPFTPGIIPRRRHELARAIGRMVSEELVTAETIVARLREPAARDGIGAWIDRATAGLLQTRLADVAKGVHGGAEAGPLIAELLEGFLASEHLETVVRSGVGAILSSLEGSTVESLTGGADPARAAARSLAGMLPGGGRLAWSDESIDAAAELVRKAAIPTGQALGAALSGPEVRSEIERRARQLLQSALEKLSTLQRFFVHAGRYDRRLDEQVPGIVEDGIRQIAGFLADASTQDALALAVRDALARRAVSEPASGGGAAEALASGGTLNEALVDLLASLLRPLFSRPVLPSAEGLLGKPVGEIEAALSARVVAAARKPGAARSLLGAVGGAASSVAESDFSLGDLLGIRAETKARLDAKLADKAIQLLEARLPEMLAGLDLGSTVERRIDGLDVADVERLLMMVIARHLKWINVFGAILGALIGSLQVLIGLLS
jgi:hypothetical protein